MLRPTAWLGHPARPRLHALLPLRFPSLSVYGRACPAEVSSTLSLLSLLGSIINCRGRTLTCWPIKEQRLHRLRRTLILLGARVDQGAAMGIAFVFVRRR